MKAIVLNEYGGPDKLHVEDRPIPTPSAEQVLIEVVACGVCGHDQSDRQGLVRRTLPLVLGHEIAGIVTEVGESVSGFKPGDRVAAKQFSTCGHCEACRSGDDLSCTEREFNYGGYAEYVALHHTSLIHVPDEVDLKSAAVLACTTGTTLQALKNVAKVRPGEFVVITGAGGGLGLQGLQVAKAMGARTVAVTSSEAKVKMLREYGADEVVLAREPDFWKQILDVTNGRGASVVLDNVGNQDLFGPCFRALGQKGRYVFTGQVARTKVEVYPAFVFAKEAIITGSVSTTKSSFTESMELLRTGQIRQAVQEFALSEAVEAHEVLDHKGFFGRGVLVP